MNTNSIRIGCAAGFWGDSMIAAPQLIAGGELNYLVFDYLAEITMSIMARARAKDPNMGYAHDFVTQTMKNSLAEIARRKIKVVANAGGLNPSACGAALRKLIEQAGLDLKVATVEGDDMTARAEEFRAKGVREMYSGEPFPKTMMSINAYFGAFPIAEALGAGADIVVTGRCVDSAVALGPCIHEFGWMREDYDQIAGGSLAGHIIECGAQCTGGLFTDWRESEGWENIGYPVVEVLPDGSFLVSKPPNTGGLVTIGTVGEQILYEIGDPQAYILPDVVCDFSQVQVEQKGKDLVRVSGAKGLPPTPQYKVCGTYLDQHRITATLTIGGIDAKEKGLKTAEAVLKRCRAILKRRGAPDYTETCVETLGGEWTYGPHSRFPNPREVIVKLSAKHPVPEALELLLRELTSAGTSMSPGTSGMGGNRPKPSPVVRLFSFLMDKSEIKPTVKLGEKSWEATIAPGRPFDPLTLKRPAVETVTTTLDGLIETPLLKLAWGRSGDKGDKANIGVMARKPEYLPWIRSALTEESVQRYLAHLVKGSVERYDLPGIHGLNFLLHEALGGGGIASLRTDPQGKAMAQMLMDFPVRIPRALAEREGLVAVS